MSNFNHIIRGVTEDDAHARCEAFRQHQNKKLNTYWEIEEEGYVTILKYFTKYEIVLRKK